MEKEQQHVLVKMGGAGITAIALIIAFSMPIGTMIPSLVESSQLKCGTLIKIKIKN